MAAQVPLTAARDRIEQAQGSGDHGLAGIDIDAEHNSIVVHWHGSLPAAVTAEIDRAKSQGITVTVKPAAYSWLQLEAEMKRLSDESDAKANRDHVAPVIASIGPRDDFSGLDAGVTSDAATASAEFAASSGDLSSSIPVTTHRDQLKQPTSLSRQDDSAPFYGGAEMVSSADAQGRYTLCSSGFGVHDSAGNQFILTAAHCGWDNWYTFAHDTRQSIGRTTQILYSYDAMLISARSDHWVYDGAFLGADPSAQFWKPVSGLMTIGNGNWLCVSGAESGAFCNIKVNSSSRQSISLLDKDGVYRSALLWRAKEQSSSPKDVIGEGDSGGPAFGLSGDFSQDIAIGTISAMDNPNTSCNGVPASGGTYWGTEIDPRKCDSTFWFASAWDEMANLGVTTP
jgi:hypothetical protein